MEMKKIKERIGKGMKIIGFFLAFVLPAIAIEEDYYLIRTPLFSDRRWRPHHDWRLAGRRKSPLDVAYDRGSLRRILSSCLRTNPPRHFLYHGRLISDRAERIAGISRSGLG